MALYVSSLVHGVLTGVELELVYNFFLSCSIAEVSWAEAQYAVVGLQLVGQRGRVTNIHCSVKGFLHHSLNRRHNTLFKLPCFFCLTKSSKKVKGREGKPHYLRIS